MRHIRLVAVSSLLALAGCASMSDAIKDKNSGTAKLYDLSCERLWPLSIRVLRDAGAGSIEEHKDEHYMLADSGMNLVTAGTFMAAWLEPAAGHKCNVTIVTKRRISTSIATTLTEGGYQGDLTKLAEAQQP